MREQMPKRIEQCCGEGHQCAYYNAAIEQCSRQANVHAYSRPLCKHHYYQMKRLTPISRANLALRIDSH